MIHEGKGKGEEDKVRGGRKGMTGIWKVGYAEGKVWKGKEEEVV